MSVALPDDLLNLLRSSVGGSAGAKAKTRFREVRIEDRRQDLADGLLDEAINHVWGGGCELHIATKRSWDLQLSRIRIIAREDRHFWY